MTTKRLTIADAQKGLARWVRRGRYYVAERTPAGTQLRLTEQGRRG